MKSLALALLATASFGAAAQAQTSYLSCAVRTTFRKPYVHGTEWMHEENNYTKIFKIDATPRGHRSGTTGI